MSSFTQSDTIKITYKKLYEKKCDELQEVNKKMIEYKNKIKFLEEQNKKFTLTITNSNTAKNGYKEEDMVCIDLNTNEILKISFDRVLNLL